MAYNFRDFGVIAKVNGGCGLQDFFDPRKLLPRNPQSVKIVHLKNLVLYGILIECEHILLGACIKCCTHGLELP